MARGIVCEGEQVEVDWQPDWDVQRGIGGGGQANASHTGEVIAKL